MKPETCEVLRMTGGDQIAACYINPLEHCPAFEECIEYLLKKIREEAKTA